MVHLEYKNLCRVYENLEEVIWMGLIHVEIKQNTFR
jgi:hypothetical protein